MEDDDSPTQEYGFTGESGEVKSTERPVPEWAKPVKRSDAVGNLMWQLCGPLGGMPDFTAAIPLMDALREERDLHNLERFQKALIDIVREVRCRANRPRDLHRFLLETARATRHKMSVLLYDMNSVCGVLDTATKMGASEQLVETVQVLPNAGGTVVRADVGYVGRGSRVGLEDGRRGFALKSTGDDGMTEILLNAE